MFATLPMQSALEQAINIFRYWEPSLIQNGAQQRDAMTQQFFFSADSDLLMSAVRGQHQHRRITHSAEGLCFTIVNSRSEKDVVENRIQFLHLSGCPVRPAWIKSCTEQHRRHGPYTLRYLQ